MFIIYSTVSNKFDKMENNDNIHYYTNMMVLFTNICKYLNAILQLEHKNNIMKNAMRNHSKIFAHFTTEADATITEAGYDAKKTETSEIYATSTIDDDAKKAKQDKKDKEEAEELAADADLSSCQQALNWAFIKSFESYKTLIECRDMVINSISAVDIYIFMSNIHIKEQDWPNDDKRYFINFLGLMLFTTEQRTFLKIY